MKIKDFVKKWAKQKIHCEFRGKQELYPVCLIGEAICDFCNCPLEVRKFMSEENFNIQDGV